ncbi:hypothetical protein VCHC64A1_01633B, partial [Vibrio cholerae HC-64A1]
PSQ